MNDMNPINYKIHLEPDLKTFRFLGSTEIVLEAVDPVSQIRLDAAELAFWSCEVLDGDDFASCPFYVDTRSEELTISLPKEGTGVIVLKISYMGQINDKMRGFYRSRYKVKGREKYCAVTQFEESDACKAFPCFDHPSKKATFDVEMVVDEDLIALSNGPIIEERSLAGGRKSVTFQRTPKMSTYLLFFGVGEFEFIEDAGDVLVRVGTMPGMTKHARFGLKFGREALTFCEAYYGIKYPLSKLDLIAVPDFAAGAMENWGAMTFRENLLLHHSGITSKSGEQRICEVIAHEIAHQWFGDLVTPSDWKYLWLNESFATYFGYGVVTHYHPEWGVWDQFLHGQTDSALDRDALRETIPIELPGEGHVAINASTAPILYNKGASIVRQVVGYLKEPNFQEGLRRYLEKHQYGCAASAHLWEALEEISEEPITAMMKSWIEQPGFPLVEAERDDGKIILTQRRYTYLRNGHDQVWIIPVAVQVFYESGRSQTKTTLFEGKTATIDVGRDVVAYKINYGQTGFYRVRYLKKNDLNELGKRVLTTELPAEDRWGLQNDFYALIKGGEAALDEYLDFLSHYKNDDAFLPLISIASNLFDAYLVMEGMQRAKIASVGKSFLEKVLTRIGYEPDPNEEHTISILRDQIMVDAAIYGSADAAEFGEHMLRLLTEGKSIHPDIMKSVMQIGALNGDEHTFRWLVQRFKSSESEHERMNLLAALGSFQDDALIRKVQAYVLSVVPDRNKFIPITYMASNPHAVSSLWEWYESHVSAFERFHPMHYERVIGAIVPVCGIERKEQVAAFFAHYMKQKDKAHDVIKLSLERLTINSRMRVAASSGQDPQQT